MSAQSRYHDHKRQAFESFIRFAEGREMPQWPLEVFLEASNICDLKCAMCPTFSALNPKRFSNLRSRDRGVLDVEQAMTSLDEVLRYAPVVHAHGYGEPTIHPQFREMIDALAEYEVMVDFFSNGMHFTPEMSEFLVSRRLARVTISFSGTTAEEYENVYIGGKFEQVLEGISNLDAAKRAQGSQFPRIDVNSIGFRHHVEKLPEFVEMMGKRGVNVIHLKPLSLYDPIPELYGHRAEMRAEVEGPLLQAARDVAKEYKLHLALEPFEGQVEVPGQDDDTEVVAITDLKNIAKSVDMSKEVQGGPAELYDPREDAEVAIDGVACLEPYKTLYAKYGGDVFPCCFKTYPRGLASLEQGASDRVWHADGFEYMRERALEKGYGRKMCGKCIKKASYPKYHNVNDLINRYSRWYEASFGTPFDERVRRYAPLLPDNETILRNWREGPQSLMRSQWQRLGDSLTEQGLVATGKRVAGAVMRRVRS